MQKMKYVVTASRLRDGTVVYLAPDHNWVTQLEQGLVIGGASQRDAVLDQVKQDAEIVDPYACAVTSDASGIRPCSAREHIRANGPTVLRELLARTAWPPSEFSSDRQGPEPARAGRR